ncbi:alpha/beta fold hydrolase [Spongiactinospora sp. TRM90649]|uniref:alpha/beta fold hydrolase n=1 Tax=Spongiactinospora sp. TRM90649 TaxID=3031114 RepID=UPI0023FA43AC|nr:alpha/beta fold hydrolase [Spongiactinospora sp. TRM90649]MDF5756759.1 alpha/beta fold hydrolase [Spongiactinospora sp. TRM90649]
MRNAIAAEWVKFRTLRSNAALLAASVSAVLVGAGMAFLVSRGFDNQSGDDLLRFDGVGPGLGAGLPVAYLVFGALGALTVTAEHATGMIGAGLVAEPRRQVYLFAKVPVVAGIGLAAGLALAFGMHLAALAVFGERAGHVLLSGETLAVPVSDGPRVLAEVLLAGASVPLVALVGLGLGALIRSTAGTLVTLIVIVFALPVAAQALPGVWRARIGSFMIESLPGQIAGSGGPGVLSPVAALAVLVAYPVAALALGSAAIALRGGRARPLVAGALAVAVLGAVPALPAGVAVASPAWRACGGELRCATVSVPLDWSRPSGRRVDLRVAMLPATGTHRVIGTVFSIPGGPGGSGIDDLRKQGGAFAALRERFDVVSFAPRNSTDQGVFPERCFTSGPVLKLPDGAAEYDAQAARIRKAALDCRAADPEYFDHLDSLSVARDIDAVRAALGAERLSLVATSYGGVPAVAYARLFPTRVRAMYLDGAVNHLVDRATDQRMRQETLERQFARFAAWCDATEECALHGRDVPALWRELIADADRRPLPVKGERVTYSGFDIIVAASPHLVSPGPAPERPLWRELAKAVGMAAGGDGSGFADYLKARIGRPDVPSFVGMNMTHCPDGQGLSGYEEYRRLRDDAERRSPNLAGNRLWHTLACAGWPAPVANPRGPLPARGLPPMLAAGSWTDHDDTAAIVARVPGSSTVRLDGPGHGLYLTGQACAIAHANRYLVTLRTPPRGTVCAEPAGD